MIKAGIDDGDLILIRKQETAKQGNVAFLYDNEQTTLKRYKQTDDAIYLCPENDSMQPIVIRGVSDEADTPEELTRMVRKAKKSRNLSRQKANTESRAPDASVRSRTTYGKADIHRK